MINFGFYTCFCFQWTLFENFVSQSVLGLAADGLLPPRTSQRLTSLKFRTGAFLKYIDAGHVFGRSPFTTVLPLAGWTPRIETCGFVDLDAIRTTRNGFIHGIRGSKILPDTEVEKEHLYERSMWILRNFAGNTDQEVRGVRELSP
jgi:hypothetical protein